MDTGSIFAIDANTLRARPLPPAVCPQKGQSHARTRIDRQQGR